MTEENDIEVSKEDLDAAEKEVLDAAKKSEDEIRRSIEAKLKKEMEEKKKAEEEAARIQTLEKENSEMQKMLHEERSRTQKELDELRAKIGKSKAIHTNDNPTTPKQGLPLDNQEVVKDINDASEDAFLEHYGLTKAQWRGRR